MTNTKNEVKAADKSTKTPGGKFRDYLQKARNTKSTRIWVIVLLIVIVIVLYLFGLLKKGFAIGIGIILLAALGLQVFDYDLDLGTLWRTGDIQQSRVQYTNDGIKILGSCVKPQGGTKEYDLNCSNFTTQREAQAKYDQCADEIASNNAGKTSSEIKNLDIYGLDGDKDGIVCEALPS
jgi:hypothetical protein